MIGSAQREGGNSGKVLYNLIGSALKGGGDSGNVR